MREAFSVLAMEELDLVNAQRPPHFRTGLLLTSGMPENLRRIEPLAKKFASSPVTMGNGPTVFPE